MIRTYHGSCHCGAVRFRADIDLAAGSGRCNCSICTKTRQWNAIVKPDAFELLAGTDALVDYQFGTGSMHHPFCHHCGVRAFGHGELDVLGGAFYSVALACLDDVTAQELVDTPIRYADGQHDAWHQTPVEVRHL